MIVHWHPMFWYLWLIIDILSLVFMIVHRHLESGIYDCSPTPCSGIYAHRHHVLVFMIVHRHKDVLVFMIDHWHLVWYLWSIIYTRMFWCLCLIIDTLILVFMMVHQVLVFMIEQAPCSWYLWLTVDTYDWHGVSGIYAWSLTPCFWYLWLIDTLILLFMIAHWYHDVLALMTDHGHLVSGIYDWSVTVTPWMAWGVWYLCLIDFLVFSPKGGRVYTRFPPCLESQGFQFDPTFLYLLFCSSA